METIKLAGNYIDTPEVPATIIGTLAVHRPVYHYRKGEPLTVDKTDWAVTHVPTGGSLTKYAPSSHRNGTRRTRKELLAWAEAIQHHRPAAWAEASRLPFGIEHAPRKLAKRLRAAIDAAR